MKDPQFWKITDKFDTSYWSGVDLKIYFNNILADESIQFNFQVSEGAAPYYGYNSYKIQKVYHGTRMITGEFTMNFKKDGYILSLIQNLRNNHTLPTLKTAANTKPGQVAGTYSTSAPNLPNVDLNSLISNPETATAYINQVKNLQSTTEPYLSQIDNSIINIPENSGIFDIGASKLNISVLLGKDVSKTLQLETSNTNYYFDGSILDIPGLNNYSTGIILSDVTIYGVARSHSDDGRNFVESYSFFARDIGIFHPNNQ